MAAPRKINPSPKLSPPTPVVLSPCSAPKVHSHVPLILRSALSLLTSDGSASPSVVWLPDMACLASSHRAALKARPSPIPPILQHHYPSWPVTALAVAVSDWPHADSCNVTGDMQGHLATVTALPAALPRAPHPHSARPQRARRHSAISAPPAPPAGCGACRSWSQSPGRTPRAACGSCAP